MKKVIYTAIVLENAEVLNTYIPDGWKKFCHHQTILFGDQDLPSNLGQVVELHATGLFTDDHAVAVRTSNGGHITIATSDVPPKYFNELIADANNYVGEVDFKLVGKVGAFIVNDDDSASWIFSK